LTATKLKWMVNPKNENSPLQYVVPNLYEFLLLNTKEDTYFEECHQTVDVSN